MVATNTSSSNYKLRDLRVFAAADPLAEGKRKYQQVLEQSEVSYLYAELSVFNKKFDQADWKLKVILKAFNHKGEILCDLNVEKKVKSDEPIIFIRQGWGNDKAGACWVKGGYYWEAWIDNKLVATKKFFIEDEGKVTSAENPYFDIEDVKLYEAASTCSIKEPKTYLKKFFDKETRYIWVEASFKNKRKMAKWPCEVMFNFYNSAHQLKGQCIELVEATTDRNGIFKIYTGWGSDNKTTWYQGSYIVEVLFMNQIIASVTFEVGDGFEEIKNGSEVNNSKMDVASHVSGQDESLEEIMTKMNGLIGLNAVKNKMNEYFQYIDFLKIRKEKGFHDPQAINLHAVFTGNPGTGKTTVARLLAKIYHKMGLLSKGHLVEVDRSDLVAEYIGQTAPLVKALINKARGGVLFIDEAYSLTRKNDDGKDFGKEVIEILIKEMSDGKGDIAIITAGYPEEMANFLNSNPGLKSRFNTVFNFHDYLPQELMTIAESASIEQSITLHPKAKKFLYEHLVEAYRNRDKTFGNARLVNEYISEAKMNLGLRAMMKKPGFLKNEKNITALF